MLRGDITNGVAIVEQQPLQSLIAEVRGCIRDLKSHEANEKLAAWRKRVEAEGKEWWPWFEEQEDLCSRAEAFRLLTIPGAPDAEAEEERQRQANNESHRNAREESRTSETQPKAEEAEGQRKRRTKDEIRADNATWTLTICAQQILQGAENLNLESFDVVSKKDRNRALEDLQEALPKIKAAIAELNPKAPPAPDGLDAAREHYAPEFTKLPQDERDAETDRLI
jgi:hypothetical protein